MILDNGQAPQSGCWSMDTASCLRSQMKPTGYLSHYEYLPEGEIVDEMLAILSDRNAIMQKKELEKTNAAWNEFLQHGFEEED